MMPKKAYVVSRAIVLSIGFSFYLKAKLIISKSSSLTFGVKGVPAVRDMLHFTRGFAHLQSNPARHSPSDNITGAKG
jgi:hypothetical protein